ncbi:MAG: PIG-L deacetylase family protein [Acidimicrobiales bacterium]
MPDETVIRDVPLRVLAVYAHPDDPDISCGGTLAKWSAAGSEVHVVLCARGDKGSLNPDDDPKEVARRRFDEARRATDLLGVRSLQHLDRPDGELENDLATREELVAIIRRVTPDVVVCPDPSAVFFGGHHYNHRDHRVVGWAVLDSVAPAAASPLYFPEAGPPHQVTAVLMSGSLEPNAWVDVTTTIDLKVRAVGCHESQLEDANDWFASALRDGAEEAGRQAGVPFAEAFRRLALA